MTMFKGVKPAGQPRTVRSNIEQYNNSANFPAEPPHQEFPQVKDAQGPAPTPRREGAAGKNPFGGLRNG